MAAKVLRDFWFDAETLECFGTSVPEIAPRKLLTVRAYTEAEARKYAMR